MICPKCKATSESFEVITYSTGDHLVCNACDYHEGPIPLQHAASITRAAERIINDYWRHGHMPSGTALDSLRFALDGHHTR
jgi:hypothetical protein